MRPPGPAAKSIAMTPDPSVVEARSEMTAVNSSPSLLWYSQGEVDVNSVRAAQAAWMQNIEKNQAHPQDDTSSLCMRAAMTSMPSAAQDQGCASVAPAVFSSPSAAWWLQSDTEAHPQDGTSSANADMTADESFLAGGPDPKQMVEEVGTQARSAALELFLEQHQLMDFAPKLRGHSLEGIVSMDEDELFDVCVEAQMKGARRKLFLASVGSARRTDSLVAKTGTDISAGVVRPGISDVFNCDPRMISPMHADAETILPSESGPLQYFNTIICFCTGQRHPR